MTDREKDIIKDLNHSLYTVEYLEEWVNRNENIFVNAPAALRAMSAKGYYEAVKRMAASEPPRMTGREAVARLFG